MLNQNYPPTQEDRVHETVTGLGGLDFDFLVSKQKVDLQKDNGN